MPELSCQSKLHALLIDENTIEIKCNSRFCGAKPGWVVLHRFDSRTGELLDTEKFQNPPVPEGK